MATKTAYANHTLIELANRTKNGNVMEIAEILAESNPILNDIPYRMANDTIGEQITRRVALPSGTWRKVNQGVATEASQTETVIEQPGMLEARSEIDEVIVNANANPGEYRNSEDNAFVQGLGNSCSEVLFYGNQTTEPEKFNGLATRYNSLSDENVFGTGGTGSDLTSIFVVQWGFDKVYGFFPRGSEVGLSMEDLGVVDAEDSGGNKFRAYSSLFRWRLGLAVKQPKAVKRICNIETTGTSNIFDDELLIEALNKLPTSNRTGTRIYCNATLKTQMDIYAVDKSNVNYSSAEIGGMDVTMFKGVPVVQCDGIVDTESQVS